MSISHYSCRALYIRDRGLAGRRTVVYVKISETVRHTCEVQRGANENRGRNAICVVRALR